jgi:hypothetical protein
VDFILIVVVRTVGDYEAMTGRLLFANKRQAVPRFVAMDRVKVSPNIALDPQRDRS